MRLAFALAVAIPFQPLAAQHPPEALAGDTVVLADVAVATENTPPVGKLPRTRNTAPPGSGGLELRFAPGETVDAGFVRKQFEHNGLIGRPVAAAALVDLVQLLNAALLREGFVNTGVVVEPQSPLADNATLRLRLVYGRLGSADGSLPPIRFDWARGRGGLSDAWVTRRMPSVRQSPVDAAAIERDFRLLSDDPAVRTVRAELKGLERAGEAQLALAIDPAPRFDLYGTLANNRPPSIGGERAALGGSIRNVLSGGDLLAAEVGNTRGATDAAGSFSTPFLDPRLRLNLRAGLNNAAVIDPELLALDISARDRFFEGGLSWTLFQRPLLPVEGKSWISARALSSGLSFIRRRTTTFLFGEPFSFTPGSVRGRAEYSALRGTIELVHRGPAQAMTFVLTGTLGLSGTRSDVPEVAQPPRNFTAALAQFNYARRLNANKLELRSRVTAQWTKDVLYTAERFSVGGSNSVRGYRENLILADRGVVGSVEVAQPFSLSGRAAGRSDIDLGAFTASLFVDGAWVDNVGPNDPAPDWIASVGASLLWTPSDALSARLTYGESLRRPLLVGRRDLQDRGIQFMITVRPLAFFAGR